MSNRITVFVETREDWCPSYALNSWFSGKKPVDTKLLEVSFLGNICSDPDKTPIYRTRVWGAGDFGMEFDTSDFDSAYRTFVEVIGLPPAKMTRSTLKNLGLVLRKQK